MTKTHQRVSEATRQRVRDYAVAEPSYTVAFAAWELGISQSAVRFAHDELAARGIVREVEPKRGPFAAVYAYAQPETTTTNRRAARPDLPELDAARAARGKPVPHTRAQGSAGKPGADRKRQARGVKIKRQRNGT